MTQATTWSVQTSGPATPDAVVARMNDSLNALLSQNKGSARPAYVLPGSMWVDDSTSPWSVKVWDGVQDIIFATVNPTAHTMLVPFNRLPAMFVADGQIKFPATQAPSADPNTFDDYEEGTWTPGLAFGGASTGMTFSAQSGAYTKAGKLVMVHGRLALTAKGTATGTASIEGLPFVNHSSVTLGTVVFSVWTGMAGLTTLVGTTTTISNITLRTTGATAMSFATEANFTDTASLTFSAIYQTSN